MSIGTFGELTFEVSDSKVRTIDEFKRKTAAKFEEHAILGLKPKLEFIAPGLAEISFQVVFSALLGTSPLKEIEQLKETMQKGEYQSLVIGGKVLGDFVIESMAESWKHIDNKGNLLHAAVDLSLKEYVTGK
ncbi:phage tail protein [uncultured Anaeromusa sp.]|uniref:phage tail protein n=1 Tax=uncultured Anaeromusa sp. TaxID=673273 RepID=UPI0029C94B3C|nr:phage tail protein [uncultured Anaeromusa sp.]